MSSAPRRATLAPHLASQLHATGNGPALPLNLDEGSSAGQRQEMLVRFADEKRFEIALGLIDAFCCDGGALG